MKATVKHKITIETTLDSSEMVMFTKGGKHKVELPADLLAQISDKCELEISVQLERSEQMRYDHVTQHQNTFKDIYNQKNK